MGHKALKEHYRIEHSVCVTDKGICIGSPYIHDIIILGSSGNIIKSYDGLSNGELKRYMEEFRDNPPKLRDIIQSRDAFHASIPVYTYDGGDIIERMCEAVGWPNVTHDGYIMYDNMYSTDRLKVLRWAKDNAEAGIQSSTDRIEELKSKIKDSESRLLECKLDLTKLNQEPTVPKIKKIMIKEPQRSGRVD